MYVAFARNVLRLSQMNGVDRQFCELSLSLFYANHDEDYDIWVVKFAISQASTSFMKMQLKTFSLSPAKFIWKLSNSVACRTFGLCTVV